VGRDALHRAAATSGQAVIVSGMTVLIAMAGLLLAGSKIFTSLGIGAMIVVLVSMIGSLTVLPALLAKLGRWVDRPRIPLIWRLSSRTGEPRVWPKLLRPALNHPKTTLVVSVGLLLALAAPALGMQLAGTGSQTLPRTIPVMQTYDRLTAAFPNEGTTHMVAVKADAAKSGEIDAAFAALTDQARGNRLFSITQQPPVQTSADRTVHTIELATPFPGDSPQGKQSLEVLRTQLVPATLGHVSGAQYAVGGEVAGDVDWTDHISSKLPLVVAFVLLLTFIMLAFTFRSLVVALTALVLNLLSAGAAFGVLTLVFQYTWAEGLLDFHSSGAIVNWLPLFLFVVLFGLSMDYHVFVVSRIREAALSGMSTKDAVAHGITRSAGVVTSAALVMVAVFGIFATLSMLEMKQMGIGLSVAVFLDAMVIRVLVLPSVMALLGRANWWPSKAVRRSFTGSSEAGAPTERLPQMVR
jgi:RND superfamily putative drug exporter